MTPTDNLVNKARRLCDARAPEGFDTYEHELAMALDDFDAQQVLTIQIRSRLSDERLREIMEEEVDEAERKVGRFEDGFGGIVDAGVKAMRRIADYADHLCKLMVGLEKNCDLTALVYEAREQEGLGWEGPKVKLVGQIISGIIAEAQACKPETQVDNSTEAVDLPLGHA